MSCVSGVEKTLEKIRKMIDSGSHYEAQQMLKTVYHRHKARKQITESYTVLAEGAAMQLQHSQVTCGVELGIMLVEAFTLDKAYPLDEAEAALLAVLSCLPPAPSREGAAEGASGTAGNQGDSALEEEARLVAACVKWAHKRGQQEVARKMHDVFAQHVWHAYGWRHMGRATQHFVRGRDAYEFAEALVSCSRQAPASEADLFICRAVLQTLGTASKASASRQLVHATDLFEECFIKCDPECHHSPLVHFTDLLLKALARRSRSLTALLKQKYSASLSRDAVFGAYLMQVERVYLGIGAESGGGLSGLLGGLLKSLTTLDEEGGNDGGEMEGH